MSCLDVDGDMYTTIGSLCAALSLWVRRLFTDSRLFLNKPRHDFGRRFA